MKLSLTLAGKPIREDGNHSSQCISICNTTYSLKSSLIFHSNTVSLNRHERDSKNSRHSGKALTYHPLHRSALKRMSDPVSVNVIKPLMQFAKNSKQLIIKCTKPDYKGKLNNIYEYIYIDIVSD